MAPMFHRNDRDDVCPAPTREPVGIVVREGEGSASRTPPRAVAFIWGGEVLPTPSLPFGRWKTGMLTVA